MTALTTRDIESIVLEARAEVLKWKEEFIAEFTQPDRDIMLLMFWVRLSPDMRLELQARQPEAFADVERQVKEAEERVRNGKQFVR